MVNDALAKFDRIYDLQADGRVFDTPEELWGESVTATLHCTTSSGTKGLSLFLLSRASSFVVYFPVTLYRDIEIWHRKVIHLYVTAHLNTAPGEMSVMPSLSLSPAYKHCCVSEQ